MSDTPGMDAIDSAYRRSQGILDTPDKLTPQQIEAEQRKYAESRLDGKRAREQKEFGKSYAASRKVLMATVESVRHGQVLDDAEKADMVKSVNDGLGKRAPKGFAVAFVDSIAEPMADGDKGAAWKIADAAAERLANKGWKPTPPEREDDLPMDEVLARIPRG